MRWKCAFASVKKRAVAFCTSCRSIVKEGKDCVVSSWRTIISGDAFGGLRRDAEVQRETSAPKTISHFTLTCLPTRPTRIVLCQESRHAVKYQKCTKSSITRRYKVCKELLALRHPYIVLLCNRFLTYSPFPTKQNPAKYVQSNPHLWQA
jgi:hypothetical protein